MKKNLLSEFENTKKTQCELRMSIWGVATSTGQVKLP